VPAYGPQNDVTLKMPAFEWVHVQLHQQKGMISLSPPTICNSAVLDIYSSLSLIWRYSYCLVFQGATSPPKTVLNVSIKNRDLCIMILHSINIDL
ncbi:hypothetical protein ABNF75_25645, partial [Escherichia coli]